MAKNIEEDITDPKKYPLKKIDRTWVQEKITNDTVIWAESFGHYLAQANEISNNGKLKVKENNPQHQHKGNKHYQKNKKVSYYTSKELSTTQLRKFFGELKRIQALGYDDKTAISVILLKPKLAYAVGREKSHYAKIKNFAEELSKAIDWISNKNDFNNFVKIVEAIVAYHKEKGGE